MAADTWAGAKVRRRSEPGWRTSSHQSSSVACLMPQLRNQAARPSGTYLHLADGRASVRCSARLRRRCRLSTGEAVAACQNALNCGAAGVTLLAAPGQLLAEALVQAHYRAVVQMVLRDISHTLILVLPIRDSIACDRYPDGLDASCIRSGGLQQTPGRAEPLTRRPTGKGPCAVAHVVVVANDDKINGRQVRVLHRQRRRDDALRPDALQSTCANGSRPSRRRQSVGYQIRRIRESCVRNHILMQRRVCRCEQPKSCTV